MYPHRCFSQMGGLKGVHSRDVTRRTRWQPPIMDTMACLLPSKGDRSQFPSLPASIFFFAKDLCNIMLLLERTVSYIRSWSMGIEIFMWCLWCFAAAGVRVLFSYHSHILSPKEKRGGGGGGGHWRLWWLQSSGKPVIFHVIKAALWKPVGDLPCWQSFDLWNIQKIGTRFKGESYTPWAPSDWQMLLMSWCDPRRVSLMLVGKVGNFVENRRHPRRFSLLYVQVFSSHSKTKQGRNNSDAQMLSPKTSHKSPVVTEEIFLRTKSTSNWFGWREILQHGGW